jgi:hypothetical protein
MRRAITAMLGHAMKKFSLRRGVAASAVKNAIHEVKQKPQNNGLRARTDIRFLIAFLNAGNVFSVSFQTSEIKATNEPRINKVKNIESGVRGGRI